jgi:hypothetical protein
MSEKKNAGILVYEKFSFYVVSKTVETRVNWDKIWLAFASKIGLYWQFDIDAWQILPGEESGCFPWLSLPFRLHSFRYGCCLLLIPIYFLNKLLPYNIRSTMRVIAFRARTLGGNVHSWLKLIIQHVEYSVPKARVDEIIQITAHWGNLLTPTITSDALLSW